MIALSMACGLRAETQGPPWRMDEFMISLWGGPGNAELARCLAEDARFNTVMGGVDWTPAGGPELLDLAHEHGMRVLMKINPETVTDEIISHPALWGYYVFDEPVQQNVSYADILPSVTAHRAVDRGHPVYINLNNADDPVAFIETIQPDLLSIDRYQWWYGREDYFPLLERYRKLSLEHDIPLIWWVEANADENRSNTPEGNRRMLKQSVYTALAYGVKGIQWFGWGEACSWEPKGEGRWGLKPAGEDVAAINAELQALGPTLMGLESVDVFHTEPLPRGAKRLPDTHWVHMAESGYPHLVMGMFRDGEGLDYILLANGNFMYEKLAALNFQEPVLAVERLDKKTGAWVPLTIGTEGIGKEHHKLVNRNFYFQMYSQRSGGSLTRDMGAIVRHWQNGGGRNQFTEIMLAAGDGELLRVTRDLGPKTVR